MEKGIIEVEENPFSQSKRGIVNELHKPARKRFSRRNVFVRGIDDLWQADLIEMIPYSKINGGKKYILMIIDVLSKCAWAEPLNNKTGRTVTSAMQSVFDKSGRIPRNVQTDQGTDFYNKEFKLLMKEYGINHFSTFTHLKASVVERLNRTIKNWMYKEFSVHGNYKWVDMLPQLISKYNSKVHRSIGMKPRDVTKAHENMLIRKLNVSKVSHVPKFHVNDRVRVSKYKTLFEKGYTPNWSTELFKIVRVRRSSPPVYYLQDYEGNVIKGAFYEHELQKTNYPDTYLVEKVLKRRGNRVYVKWLGFPSRYNSYINTSQSRVSTSLDV